MNPFYLPVGEIDGYIKKNNGSKYLHITLTGSNSEVLKKYTEIWRKIKDQIKKINNGKLDEYEKH